MSAVATSTATGKATRPACEMADVLRRYGEAYRRTHRVPPSHHKVMRAITNCRTAALGGHRERCPRCEFVRYAYNSCRNRHCPKCQAVTKAQWLADREAELLPVPYFHNVFTVPHELNCLFLSSERNQREMLKLLFRATSDTLLTFGRNNLRGLLGFTAILHTWDQQLRPHYHLHCAIPGGALAENGSRWNPARSKTYLFSVKALGIVFRAKFLEGLQQLVATGQLSLTGRIAHLAGPAKWKAFLTPLWHKSWNVYSKPPFGGPEKVLDYLGRYTHRVAISNHRLLSAEDGTVRFLYRDRAAGDVIRTCSLPAEKFIARFLLHVLPSRFMRIRHFGFLANRRKNQALARSRELLGVPKEPENEEPKRTLQEWMLALTGMDITQCPRCGHRPLQRTELPPLIFHPLPSSFPRAPPCHSP